MPRSLADQWNTAVRLVVDEVELLLVDGLGLERDAGEFSFAIDAPVIVGVAALAPLEGAVMVRE